MVEDNEDEAQFHEQDTLQPLGEAASLYQKDKQDPPLLLEAALSSGENCSGSGSGSGSGGGSGGGGGSAIDDGADTGPRRSLEASAQLETRVGGPAPPTAASDDGGSLGHAMDVQG